MGMSAISRAWSLYPLKADQWVASVGPILDLRGMVMGSIYTGTAAPTWSFIAVSGIDRDGSGLGPDNGSMFDAAAAALPTMTFTIDGWTTIPWEYFQVPFVQIIGSATANVTKVFLNG